MNIPALGPQPFRPLLPQPAPGVPDLGTPGDRVTLSGGGQAKKNYRALAWAGFGVQIAGAGLTFAGHGAVGVAIFAAGAAMIVVGETMARRS